MKNVVVFNADVLQNIEIAQYFVNCGRKVILHSEVLTDEIRRLSQHSLVQLRMGRPDHLTQMAGMIV